MESEVIEINKVYNCDALELMRKMAQGGGKSRLAHRRPTLRDRCWLDAIYQWRKKSW